MTIPDILVHKIKNEKKYVTNLSDNFTNLEFRIYEFC